MITIHGEIHSSKNSRRVFRRGNRTIVAKSSAAKADEEMLSVQLKTQVDQWEKMTAGKSFPLFVAFHFTRRTRAKWDFANLVQGVADAMVKAGYLPDDDVMHFIPVYGGHSVDKHQTGVDFWVV
jgi:Holliday junction resolvase RusA-like endonuclease